MATIHLVGEPAPKQRPRVGAGGIVYTPAKTQAAEEAIRWQLLSQKVQPATGPVAVTLEFRTSTRRRVDLDNLVKLVLDAANGYAWADDAQVVELHATVQRGSTSPGIDLTIVPLPEEAAA
jgi:crossover junction endodeoxyribonuclease RusA